MADLKFVNASEMLDYIFNRQFDVTNFKLLSESVLPVSARLSPKLVLTGKQVLDEIQQMDKWISDLATHRQALVNLLDKEDTNG